MTICIVIDHWYKTHTSESTILTDVAPRLYFIASL